MSSVCPCHFRGRGIGDKASFPGVNWLLGYTTLSMEYGYDYILAVYVVSTHRFWLGGHESGIDVRKAAV